MIHTQVSPPPPSWPRYVLFVAGLVVAGVSQWFIFTREEWLYSSWGLVLGSLLAAWAAGRSKPMRAAETRPVIAMPVGGARATLGTILTLGGFSAAAAGSWLLSAHWISSFGTGFLLVIGGTAAFSGGLALVDHRYRKEADPLPWLRWEIVAFAAIVVLGLFLRFYRYDTFPPPDGICAIEEPQSGMGALAIRDGLRPWEFLLDRWMPVPFMAIFGDSFTSIRLPFTIVSWLTIVPLYLLLRQLVSRPAALSATLLFTFCRWHLAYARHAHAVFGPTPLLILVALYLSVKVYRRGGLAPYPWIGLLCAYTLYAYAGYRATPAFVGLFFAVSVAQHLWERRTAVIPSARAAIRSSLRVQLSGFLLAAIGFGFLAAPLYYRLAEHPAYFVEAVDRATNNDQYYNDDTARMLQQRIDRSRDAAMMFSYLGDGSAVFNMPGTPQLDPISGTLLVLGLAYCILWGGRRMQGFFAFYFVVLLAFGTVFTHNFDIRRLEGIVPLIFILVAFFLDGAREVTRRRLGGLATPVLALVATLVGGLAFVDNYNVYFRDMMSNSTVRQAFHTNYTVAIRYYHDLPDNAYFRLISEMGNFFEPSDYAWWRGDHVPGDTSHDLLSLLQGQSGPWDGRELHLLIRMPTFEGAEIADLLRERFPQANCRNWRHPDGVIWFEFMECVIGPESYGDRRGFEGGVRAKYFRGGSLTPLLDRLEPAISYGFVPDECRYPTNRLGLPCKATWEGTWNIDRAGTYQVMANTRAGSLHVFVDGRELGPVSGTDSGPHRLVDTSLELAPGPHQVRVESTWSDTQSVGTQLLFRRGGESNWKLLEFWDLAEPAPDSGESEAPPAAVGDDSAGAPEPPA